jgi:hypothetical protein
MEYVCSIAPQDRQRRAGSPAFSALDSRPSSPHTASSHAHDFLYPPSASIANPKSSLVEQTAGLTSHFPNIAAPRSSATP